MTMIQETPLLCYRGHGDVVNALCWSPDGRYIASASNDATIQIWDAKTGGRIQTYSGHNAPVEAVSWSPQGSLIASGGWDKLVHVWDMLSAKCVTSYRGHTAWIRKALAWSPDGSMIASGAWDCTVHVWHASTGDVSHVYRGHNSIVTTLAWSPDGSMIASGGGCPEPVVHVWKTATGQTLVSYLGFKFSIRGVTWSLESTTLLLGGYHENVRRWNLLTGEVLMSYGYWLGNAVTSEGTRVAVEDYCVSNVTCSPDQNYFAAGVAANRVSVWNVATGENVAVYPGYSNVVAWSPDGTRIACAESYENTVNIWRWPPIEEG